MRIANCTHRGIEWQEVSGRIEVGERGRSRVHASVTPPASAGVLVRLNTRAGYTRGANEGNVYHLAGAAVLVARGRWADGDAGGLGGGPDEVWACDPAAGPVVFLVRYSGGRAKGGGWRVVYVVEADDVRVVDGGAEQSDFRAGQDPRDVIPTQIGWVCDLLDAAGLVQPLSARWRALA